MTYEEKTVSQTIDRVLSEHPGLDASAAGALDGLDQFHIGGAAATDKLIGSLGLVEGDRVLDVGSGFGGPARQAGLCRLLLPPLGGSLLSRNCPLSGGRLLGGDG